MSSLLFSICRLTNKSNYKTSSKHTQLSIHIRKEIFDLKQFQLNYNNTAKMSTQLTNTTNFVVKCVLRVHFL